MNKGLTVAIILILILGALSNTDATTYTYTSLDYPGASGTVAFGINNGGTIVGVYGVGSDTHGFSLSGTTYTPLNYPGATGSQANGINNGGTIVGGYGLGDGYSHGYSLSGTT